MLFLVLTPFLNNHQKQCLDSLKNTEMDLFCQLNSDPYSDYLIPCKMTSCVHNMCASVHRWLNLSWDGTWKSSCLESKLFNPYIGPLVIIPQNQLIK